MIRRCNPCLCTGPTFSSPTGPRTDIAGVDVGLSSKLFGPLGLAFDGNFSSSHADKQFLFAGGPELSKRFTNARLFAHAEVGGAYETQKIKSLTALADSSFAYVHV
jgi:hypothetical protein